VIYLEKCPREGKASSRRGKAIKFSERGTVIPIPPSLKFNHTHVDTPTLNHWHYLGQCSHHLPIFPSQSRWRHSNPTSGTRYTHTHTCTYMSLINFYMCTHSTQQEAQCVANISNKIVLQVYIHKPKHYNWTWEIQNMSC